MEKTSGYRTVYRNGKAIGMASLSCLLDVFGAALEASLDPSPYGSGFFSYAKADLKAGIEGGIGVFQGVLGINGYSDPKAIQANVEGELTEAVRALFPSLPIRIELTFERIR